MLYRRIWAFKFNDWNTKILRVMSNLGGIGVLTDRNIPELCVGGICAGGSGANKCEQGLPGYEYRV